MIKEIIKQEMQRQKINGVKLAELSGVNYSTLSTFLHVEKSSMNVNKVDNILNALKIKLVHLDL